MALGASLCIASWSLMSLKASAGSLPTVRARLSPTRPKPSVQFYRQVEFITCTVGDTNLSNARMALKRHSCGARPVKTSFEPGAQQFGSV